MTKRTMTKGPGAQELPGVLPENESPVAVAEPPVEDATEPPVEAATEPPVEDTTEPPVEDASAPPVAHAVPAELLAPAPRAYVLSQESISYEHELRRKYLGEDLEAICEFAGISADPVIVHSASGNLEARREASRLWRRRRFYAECRMHPSVGAWFNTLDPDRAHAVTSGQVLLHEIDLAAYQHQQITEQKKDQAHADLKAAIREGINAVVEDANPRADYPQFPSFLVIQDDGVTKLYRSDKNAKAAHMGQCKRFWILPINTTAIREYHGDA